MIFDNPEFIRHYRVWFRKPIVVTTVVLTIAFIISLIIGLQVYENAVSWDGFFDYTNFGEGLLLTFYVIANIAFLLFNNLMCMRSISYEIDHKTYDFQETNLLKPYELMIGKLFGSTVFGHFVILICLPFIIIGSFLYELPVLNILGLILIMYLFGIFTNMLSILLSTFTRKSMSFILPIGIFIGFFYFGVIGLQTNFSFFSPFETMSALINQDVYQVSFFGYLFNGLLFNVICYTYFIYWLSIGLLSKLKNTKLKFNLFTIILFLSSFQILILGIIWFKHPQIYQSYHYGYYYSNQIETVLSIAKFFFGFFTIFLLILFNMINKSADQTYKWLKNLRHNKLIQNLFSDNTPSILTIIMSSIIAIIIFLTLTATKNSEFGVYMVILFFIIFMIREILYFSIMKLFKIRLFISLVYLGLFYILLSIAFGIFKSYIIMTIFPLTGIIMVGDLSLDVNFIVAFIILIIEIIILNSIYFGKLKMIKEQIAELEMK